MILSIPRSALLWAIAGVGIEIFAYPRWSFFPLAYPVLAFYLMATYQIKSIRQSLIVGAIVTLIAAFGAFHWISFVMAEMGGFSWPVALLLHAAFSLICLPNFNSFFLLAFLWKDKVEALPLFCRPIFWSLLWVSLEFLWRPFKIFPEMVGNTQWSWLELSQIVSFGGVGAVSFLVVFFGACLFYVIRNPREKTPHILLAAWVLVMLSAHFWGANRIRAIEASPREEIEIAMVQANIGNADKAISESGSLGGLNKVLSQYHELTDQAANAKPELIIWPETAFPMSFPTAPNYESHPLAENHALKIREGARQGNYSILVGGYERLKEQDFNAAVLIGSDGLVQDSYKKVHLLVFGEFMPLASIWPELKKLNPMLGDFGTGKGPIPLQWQRPGKNTINLGINICYEALIMPFMRSLAQNGADVFVNLTNDSWFGPGNEPYQHLELAAHRTIENGRAMIRATNTGITTVIDATGKTLSSGRLFEAEIVRAKVPIYQEKINTFYLKYGELFSWLILVLTFLLGGWAHLLFNRGVQKP